MAHLLVCVIRDRTILDYAVYSRELAPVEFDSNAAGLALRIDPCQKCSQFFVIRCVFPSPRTSPVNNQSKSCNSNGIYVHQNPTKSLTSHEVVMPIVSFIHVSISYRTEVYVPGALAYHCFNELANSLDFRTSFIKYVGSLKKWDNVRHERCVCEQLYTNCDMSVSLPLLVEIGLLPTLEHVCRAWCYRIDDIVKKRYLLEDSMNWLSTLGGGYSSLGDYFDQFSQKAGLISLSQFKIALEMGDPVMTAKCRLFYALSQMQQGNLLLSKRMLRREYHFAKRMKTSDKRLIDMCQGIWSKLQYLYKQRSLRRIKSSSR